MNPVSFSKTEKKPRRKRKRNGSIRYLDTYCNSLNAIKCDPCLIMNRTEWYRLYRLSRCLLVLIVKQDLPLRPCSRFWKCTHQQLRQWGKNLRRSIPAQLQSSDDSSHKPKHGSSGETDHAQLLSPAGTTLTAIF